ncbi:hypothetical protein [Streptomyces poriticola]|uniref:hypothetical protein n=1 Tax=Streptomyces poriticola TaxID=3120506 RepID=UPI002FCE2D18
MIGVHDRPGEAASGLFGGGQDTALTYTGADGAVNGSPANHSAQLTNNFGTPVNGRAVRFALGTGATQQTCTGTTSYTGPLPAPSPLWTSR